jgi:hypothetical protein
MTKQVGNVRINCRRTYVLVNGNNTRVLWCSSLQTDENYLCDVRHPDFRYSKPQGKRPCVQGRLIIAAVQEL